MHNLEFMKGELSVRQPAEVWIRKPWRIGNIGWQKWGTARIATHCGQLQLQRSKRDLLSSQDLAWQGKRRRRGERRTFGHRLACGQTNWRPHTPIPTGKHNCPVSNAGDDQKSSVGTRQGSHQDQKWCSQWLKKRLQSHGCFYHFSCLFYKRVRIRGMQVIVFVFVFVFSYNLIIMVWQNSTWQNLVDRHLLDRIYLTEYLLDRIRTWQNPLDRIYLTEYLLDRI